MKEAIETYLRSVKFFCPKLTKEEMNYLSNGLQIIELKAKDFYIEAGSIQKEMGWVYSGLLRSYHIDDQGNDITVRFVQENRYATHFTAFITQTPCKYYIQCLEPSVIVNLSYTYMQEGYDKFPTFERLGRLAAEEMLKVQQQRIESLLFDSAETRYLNFTKDNPDLFNRISLTYLSSYLGVERQTLTRIRNNLART